MSTLSSPIAIHFPFRFSNGKVRQTTNYADLVRGQVIDVLMTNRNERVFRPSHGCDIQSALFDPRDELARHDAAGIIAQRLKDQVPRCDVISVTIDLPAGTHALVIINVQYRASKYGVVSTLSVPVGGSEFVLRGQGVTGEDNV